MHHPRLSPGRPRRGDRRGSVSVLAALTLPPLVALMALGIDVSGWGAQRIELQRLADIAAMAGAAKYAETSSASQALTAAANVAEVNGLPVGTRGGNSSTTLSDGSVAESATITFQSAASTVSVTVQQNAPLPFAPTLITAAAPTLTAVAVAQVSPRSSGQACVLALEGLGTGVTTNDDIGLSGNTTVTLNGCSLRSDASMSFSGNAHVDAAAIVASGTITTSGNAHITSCPSGQSPCDQQSAGVAQVPDPLAGTYGGDLGIPTTTVSQPPGPSLSPPPAGKAYTSLSFNSLQTVTLAAGVYYVQGSVSINGGATVTGSGVTIISGNGFSINGNANVALTAPSSGATAGLLFGSASSSSIAVTGDGTLSLRGAIYARNAGVTLTGNSDTGSAACLVVVAYTVTYTGNTHQSDSGCAALGVPPIYNFPTIARLVQ
jgi:Flp pilus assembly protein TadG